MKKKVLNYSGVASEGFTTLGYFGEPRRTPVNDLPRLPDVKPPCLTRRAVGRGVFLFGDVAILVLERSDNALQRRAQIAVGAHRTLGAPAGMVGLSLRGITELLRYGLSRASLSPADIGYLDAWVRPFSRLSTLPSRWDRAATGPTSTPAAVSLFRDRVPSS